MRAFVFLSLMVPLVAFGDSALNDEPLPNIKTVINLAPGVNEPLAKANQAILDAPANTSQLDLINIFLTTVLKGDTVDTNTYSLQLKATSVSIQNLNVTIHHQGSGSISWYADFDIHVQGTRSDKGPDGEWSEPVEESWDLKRSVDLEQKLDLVNGRPQFYAIEKKFPATR